MVDALQSLLPSPVPIHHLGMYREKTTLDPVEYYNNLPYHKASTGAAGEAKVPDLAIVVDPIIATGSTVCAAIGSGKTRRNMGASPCCSAANRRSSSGEPGGGGAAAGVRSGFTSASSMALSVGAWWARPASCPPRPPR